MGPVMNKPLLTIVIANYNYGRFLESAIKSVISQCDVPVSSSDGKRYLPIKGVDKCFVELIICDAASVDNSIEIIRKYEDSLTWWCSEKDGGQSEAFNKGFRRGVGEWLTWLNADDMYLPGTLSSFAMKAASNPQAKWITGNMLNFNDVTKLVTFVTWGPHICMPFLKRNHAEACPFGPTSFWRRSVYEELGGIDEKLDYTMDLEYWARLTMAGILQTRLNHVCWAFREHEEAKSTGKRRTLDMGTVEYEYWSKKTGHTYKTSFRNPWYWVWLFFRAVDSSLFVRFLKRVEYIGKPVSKFLSAGHV